MLRKGKKNEGWIIFGKRKKKKKKKKNRKKMGEGDKVERVKRNNLLLHPPSLLFLRLTLMLADIV
jgi:hypothetical protein